MEKPVEVEVVGLTPNQVVAWNLREARRKRGWTQEQAAQELEPYLGERWRRTTFSAAEEGTISGRRIRQFTADDLVAFSRCFDLPIAWFLLPPPLDEIEQPYVLVNQAQQERGQQEGYADPLLPGGLIEMLFSTGRLETMAARIRALNLPPWLQSRALQKMTDMATGVLGALFDSSRDRITDLAAKLQDVAKDLHEAAAKTSGGESPRLVLSETGEERPAAASIVDHAEAADWTREGDLKWRGVARDIERTKEELGLEDETPAEKNGEQGETA